MESCMKIGMVLFSHMGHTRQFGEVIQQGLEEAGNIVDLIALETQEPLKLGADQTPIKPIPELEDYDLFFLGSPVHGGRISAPMRAFFTEIDGFEGKPCIPFVTHMFWRSWGADQALTAFTENCQEKGGRILKICSVCWLSFQRKKNILITVQEMVKAVDAIKY